MTREETIDVNDARIREGKKTSCRECPVALAIAGIKGASGEHAGPAYLMFNDGGGQWLADTPQPLIDFMKDFDRGREVHPLSVVVTFRHPGP